MQSKSTDLVGRCGLYCGACSIYRAERDNPERRKRIADHLKCTVDKVRCSGCGALTPECWGWACKFIECLSARGYEYCFECPTYAADSCEIYRAFAAAYLDEDHVDLRANMKMIRLGRIPEFLRLSAEKYTCSACGKPTIAGAKKCHHRGGAI